MKIAGNLKYVCGKSKTIHLLWKRDWQSPVRLNLNLPPQLGEKRTPTFRVMPMDVSVQSSIVDKNHNLEESIHPFFWTDTSTMISLHNGLGSSEKERHSHTHGDKSESSIQDAKGKSQASKDYIPHGSIYRSFWKWPGNGASFQRPELMARERQHRDTKLMRVF